MQTLINPETKDYALTGAGDYTRDYSALTRIHVRMSIPKGRWWYRPDIGHRFGELVKRTADVVARAEKMAEEALADLADEGAITGLLVRGREVPGGVLLEIFCLDNERLEVMYEKFIPVK